MVRYRYATCYGSIYRFTRSQWVAFCREVAATGCAGMADFGTRVGDEAPDVTDWTAEDAERALKKEAA